MEKENLEQLMVREERILKIKQKLSFFPNIANKVEGLFNNHSWIAAVSTGALFAGLDFIPPSSHFTWQLFLGGGFFGTAVPGLYHYKRDQIPPLKKVSSG